MLPGTETIATIADDWLAEFERALAQSDDTRLKTLFHQDSHWRDVLAVFRENLRRFLAGEPLGNVVNKELGY
jgi:allantoicase